MRAVCSLWHFPSAYAARAFRGTVPSGVRTFLILYEQVCPAQNATVHPSQPQWFHIRLYVRLVVFNIGYLHDYREAR